MRAPEPKTTEESKMAARRPSLSEIGDENSVVLARVVRAAEWRGRVSYRVGRAQRLLPLCLCVVVLLASGSGIDADG